MVPATGLIETFLSVYHRGDAERYRFLRSVLCSLRSLDIVHLTISSCLLDILHPYRVEILYSNYSHSYHGTLIIIQLHK